MPSLSFATGLLQGYFGHQAAERDRREKNALAAADFLLKSGRVRNFNDLLPILDQGTGGTGGKKPQGFFGGMKSGAKGQDPTSILSSFIDPVLQAHQAAQTQQPPPTGGTNGMTGSDGSIVPGGSGGSMGSGSVQAPPQTQTQTQSPLTAPPAQSSGPLMSDEEMMAREGQQAATKDEYVQQAKIARAERLVTMFRAKGFGPQEATEAAYDAVGLKLPVRRADTVKNGGLAMAGSELPPGSMDLEGNLLSEGDKAEGKFYRPVTVAGQRGNETRYIPSAPPPGKAAFTGGNLQIYQRLKASHPDWAESKLNAETARLADEYERLKQSSLVIKLNDGKAEADDVDALSNQLIDGSLLPTMLSRRAKDFNHLLAEASRKSIAQTGKPVNYTQMLLQYNAAQRFAATLNGANIGRFRTLAGSVVNTIGEVKRLGETLQQGGIQLWNRAKQSTIRQVYGNSQYSEDAVQYLAAINTLKEEFANLVNGGYAPTEPAFKLANEQVNGDYGVKDLDAALTEIQRLVNYRIKALDDLKAMTPNLNFGPQTTTPPPPPPGANPFR